MRPIANLKNNDKIGLFWLFIVNLSGEIMAKKEVEPVETLLPRPTKAAFHPATPAEIRGDIFLGLFLLLMFGAGLLVNRTMNFFSFSEGIEASVSGSGYLAPLWLQLVFFFGFPLFIPAGVYFLYHAWSIWRETRAFWRGCQRGQGQIIQMWKEPPSGSGKKYFIGFTVPGGEGVFAQVDVWTFKRLQVGEQIEVQYLPEQPDKSCLVIEKPKRAKKGV